MITDEFIIPKKESKPNMTQRNMMALYGWYYVEKTNEYVHSCGKVYIKHDKRLELYNIKYHCIICTNGS